MNDITAIKQRVNAIDPSELSNDGECPSGMYGYYHNLGQGLGVKVQSCQFNAEGEFAYLERVKDSGITPYPYELREIRIDGRKRYAIFMEHIEGIRLGDIECLSNAEKRDYKDNIGDEANQTFSGYGIHHHDCHWNNIIITNVDTMEYKIIDFSPDRITEELTEDEMEVGTDSSYPKQSSSVKSDSIKGTDANQMQFEFMQDVVFTNVSVRYLLVTYNLDCFVKSEVFVNKELATEEMEGNIGFDLNFGYHLKTYKIIPFYVAKSQF